MTSSAHIDTWPFQTAPSERLYVIGDVHGEFRALQNVISAIEIDLKTRPITNFRLVFLGDYVDRGENSRHVIDLVMALCEQSNAVALLGNHEAMLLEALDSSEFVLTWRQYGGLETLTSFAVPIGNAMRGREIDRVRNQFRESLGTKRFEFLNSLPHFYQNGDFFFCHAGVRPGQNLANQSLSDLIWIREPFLSSDLQHEKMIIHGHTPVEDIEVKFNRINIDTGAYLTGRLTCLVIEDRHLGYFDSKSPHITNIF